MNIVSVRISMENRCELEMMSSKTATPSSIEHVTVGEEEKNKHLKVELCNDFTSKNIEETNFGSEVLEMNDDQICINKDSVKKSNINQELLKPRDIATLPPEIQEHILLELPPKDLATMELCSSYYRAFINGGDLWNRKNKQIVGRSVDKMIKEVGRMEESQCSYQPHSFLIYDLGK